MSTKQVETLQADTKTRCISEHKKQIWASSNQKWCIREHISDWTLQTDIQTWCIGEHINRFGPVQQTWCISEHKTEWDPPGR